MTQSKRWVERLCLAVNEIKDGAHLLEVIPSIRELINDNWAETGESFGLNADFEQIGKLIDAGFCKVFVAQSDEKIVGYAIVITGGSLWDMGRDIYTVEALYLDPEHRGSFVGGKMLFTIERAAKDGGAYMLVFSMRAGQPPFNFLGRGYQEVGTSYGKHI